MAVQIQLRRGLASQWTSSNPILAEGEIGLEIETTKYKIGNGVNYWNDLPYATNLAGLYDVPDVDTITATSPTDGSVLVYKTSINKWVATTILDKQDVDGGHF